MRKRETGGSYHAKEVLSKIVVKKRLVIFHFSFFIVGFWNDEVYSMTNEKWRLVDLDRVPETISNR